MAGIATMMIGWVLVIGFKDSFQAVGARITFLTGMGFGVVSVAVIAWILYEDRWADDGGEN